MQNGIETSRNYFWESGIHLVVVSMSVNLDLYMGDYDVQKVDTLNQLD